MSDGRRASNLKPPHWIALLLGGHVFVGGLISLLGWIIDQRRFADWFNLHIWIQPNASVCSILVGAGLILLWRDLRRPALLCGALTGLLGLATLSEHLFGATLGIDTALMFGREWGRDLTTAPGRMGMPGSLTWTLLGAGLVLAASPRRELRQTCCTVGLIATGIATLSVVGYLLGANPLYSLPRFTAISLQTATFIAAAGVGLVAAVRECEPARTLSANTGAGALARWTLPSIFILPILLGLVAVAGARARYYDAAMGTALLVLVLVALLCVVLWRGVRAVAARELELELSQRDLSDFFENASVGLHWVGPDGIIQRANQTELDLLGYTREEYVGRHIAEFHVDRDVIDDILARLARGETLREHPAQMRHKDGAILDVLINSNVLFNDGRFIHTRCFTRDVTALKRANRAQAMLAAIVASSEDAIVSKNLDGVIQSWNAGAERIFGYTPEQAVGQHVSLIIPPERLSEEQGILAKLRRGERVEHFDTVRVRRDGRRVHVSLTISPLRDETGRVVGASKIARDVTERKNAESEREHLLASERSARTAAEQAVRLKDEFLATVSHELRTPLNGILGWAQLLKRATLDEALVLEAAGAIMHGARLQAQLIEDLLDISRIVSGKLRLDVQSMELAPVVEAAVEMVRPTVEAKGIRLRTVLNPGAGVINGDPARLQQVVWNLLTNAVKFTPRNGTIQLVLTRINSQVEITVTDSGVGIAPEFLPHVFDRFRQADSSTTRQYGGLGLGLSIVKQIVELHGGQVSAESAGVNQGATFRVRLPIAVVNRLGAGEPVEAATHAVSDVKLPGVRILVVDDDPGACEVMRRLLCECDAVVETVNSGPAAIARIESFNPSLLLCDIGMPEMDGFEVIRQVREAGSTLPAVAVTAFARPDDRVRALRAGYNMHLAKPVEARELLTVIETVLRTAPQKN